MTRPLSIWTVYDRPTDFPTGYLARRWEATNTGHLLPTGETISGDLETVRSEMTRRGLVCLGRDETDEPQIVESWI